jgi:hypothetical protein
MSKFPPLLHHHSSFDDIYYLFGPPNMRGAIVFSGSSHPTLVDGICDRLGMKRGTATLGKFANGETQVQIRMLTLIRAHVGVQTRMLIVDRHVGAG